MTDWTERLIAELGWVRALARRLAVDSNDADDLAQATVLDAIARPPRRLDHVRAWLRTILERRLARDRRRKNMRAAIERGAAVNELRRNEDKDIVHLHERLSRLVLALEEPYRAAIVARFLRAEDDRIAAHALGISEATFRSHVSRGVAKLRAQLMRDYGDDGHRLRRSLLAIAGPGGWIVTKEVGVAAAVLLVFSLTMGSIAVLKMRDDARTDLDIAPRTVADDRAPQSDAGRSDTMSTATPTAVAPTEDPTTRPARHRLTDADGRAIANADLFVFDGRNVIVEERSGIDGAMTIPAPKDATSLWIFADGHAPECVEWMPANAPRDVAMSRGAPIHGRVRIDGRAPGRTMAMRLFVNVPKEAAPPRAVQAAFARHRHWAPMITVVADTEGRFDIAGLPRGRPCTLVLPEGAGLDHGSRHITESIGITAPNENFVLDLVRLPLVTGRVVRADTGLPVTHAAIEATFLESTDDGSDVRAGTIAGDTESGGRFAVGARSRNVFAVRVSVDVDGAHIEGPTLSIGDGTIDVGDIVVATPHRRALHVTDRGGRPIAEAYIEGKGRYGQVRAITDADGRATLMVAAGITFDAEAIARGFAAGVCTIDGDHTDDIVITLDPSPRLVIRVLDANDRPVPGRRVVLRRVDPRAAEATDPKDAWPFALEPAALRYSARREAWAMGNGLPLSVTDPRAWGCATNELGEVDLSDLRAEAVFEVDMLDALGRVLVTSPRFTVTPTEKKVLVLKSPHTRPHDLVVECVDRDGRPIAGVNIEITDPDGSRAAYVMSEEVADGRIVVEGIDVDRANIVVSKDGRDTPPFENLSLPADETPLRLVVAIDFPTSRTLVVHTVDEDGTPVLCAVTAFQWTTPDTFATGIARFPHLPRKRGEIEALRGGIAVTRTIDADQEEATIVLPRTATLELTLEGSPTADRIYRVTLRKAEANGAARYFSLDSQSFVRRGFTIDPVLPGAYDVAVESAPLKIQDAHFEALPNAIPVRIQVRLKEANTVTLSVTGRRP